MNNFVGKFDDDILKDKKHIHMIGIGGSGMYPLAQILHSKGYYITGSDNNETDTLKAVRSMGIEVFLGQSADNIKGADLIIRTAAIMQDNPELIAANASGVPVLERSELLGIITKMYSNAVCVSGTHGKTTVTSMITQILKQGGIDAGMRRQETDEALILTINIPKARRREPAPKQAEPVPVG